MTLFCNFIILSSNLCDLLLNDDKILAKNRAKRIVNGMRAGENQFPYQAQIRMKDTGEHLCGGTIISNRHILTAASCFPGEPIITRNFPENYEIILGSIHLDGTDGNVHDVLEYYIPGNYNPQSSENDLAIIKVGAK